MRRALVFTLFSLALCAPAGAAQESPEALYRAGDFKGAAAAYEAQLSGPGAQSARVHYNLGNSYLRLGLKGKAMLSYLRARRLSPRDADINWNIDVLNARLQDRIEEPFDFGPMGVLRQLMRFVALREAALFLAVTLLAGAVWLWLGCLLVPLRTAVRRTRGLVLLAVLAGAGFFGAKYLTLGEPTAVIVVPSCVARSGPSTNETKAFTLHAGAQASVLDSTERWYYIRLANRNVGWIEKQTAEIV